MYCSIWMGVCVRIFHVDVMCIIVNYIGEKLSFYVLIFKCKSIIVIWLEIKIEYLLQNSLFLMSHKILWILFKTK